MILVTSTYNAIYDTTYDTTYYYNFYNYLLPFATTIHNTAY